MMIKRLTVDELMAATFNVPRDPCSDAYKVGAKAAMRGLLDHVMEHRPYALGTAEADAWFAGFAEGLRLVRCALAEQAEAERPSVVSAPRSIGCNAL